MSNKQTLWVAMILIKKDVYSVYETLSDPDYNKCKKLANARCKELRSQRFPKKSGDRTYQMLYGFTYHMGKIEF